jgi:hypothetical protein
MASSSTPCKCRSLLQRTAQAAANGQFELFKTTAVFDGTAKHPEWLGDSLPRTKELRKQTS